MKKGIWRQLQIYGIGLGIHRGNIVTQVYFSGEGEHRKGGFVESKDVLEKVLSQDTFLVQMTGGEPMNQNMRTLIGICYLLKKWYKKGVIIETDSSHFNQLLFLNVRHFILHPHPETFDPHKFGRYIEYSTLKALQKYRIKELNHRKSAYVYKKFVEIVFDIRKPGDMKFASEVFTNFPIKELDLKIFIKRDLGYSMNSFAEDWRTYQDVFDKYKYLYFLENEN